MGIQHSVSLMQSDQLPQGPAAVAFPAMRDCNQEVSAQVIPFSIINLQCHVNSHNRATGQWLYRWTGDPLHFVQMNLHLDKLPGKDS